mmetsp:Transcript_148795/g.477921  ORF Transcript_148795/g.477921 Transcript_148795/m.477921 type:complete len:364 (-) Transcript_148795:125-1216(-)
MRGTDAEAAETWMVALHSALQWSRHHPGRSTTAARQLLQNGGAKGCSGDDTCDIAAQPVAQARGWELMQDRVQPATAPTATASTPASHEPAVAIPLAPVLGAPQLAVATARDEVPNKLGALSARPEGPMVDVVVEDAADPSRQALLRVLASSTMGEAKEVCFVMRAGSVLAQHLDEEPVCRINSVADRRRANGCTCRRLLVQGVQLPSSPKISVARAEGLLTELSIGLGLPAVGAHSRSGSGFGTGTGAAAAASASAAPRHSATDTVPQGMLASNDHRSQQLVARVWMEVLPKYGFDGHLATAAATLEALEKYLKERSSPLAHKVEPLKELVLRPPALLPEILEEDFASCHTSSEDEDDWNLV